MDTCQHCGPEEKAGELHMGMQTGTSVFKWVGEGETVPRSAPEYGKIVLKAYKGMVLTDISNDLLRTPRVGDAGVREDIRATVADGLDDAGFRGWESGHVGASSVTLQEGAP